MAFSRTLLLSTYLLVFFILISYAASLTFNFTNISPENLNQDIVIAGNATINNDGIQLIPDTVGSNRSWQAGRATYASLLHLWDNATGELVDFTTEFSFVVDSDQSEKYGDGFTFFLAQNNSIVTNSASMGLPVEDINEIQTDPSFVAVEFDNYWNPEWDPRDSSNSSIGTHVGIDVNSVISVKSQKWHNNITGGRECQAWIKYDSASKNLSVSFTGFQNNTVIRQVGLDHTINLADVLPQFVIFGFSAGTGDLYQKNTVKSWSFNSGQTKKKNKKRLVVGLTAGLCGPTALMALLALVWWIQKKKKKKKKNKRHEVQERGAKVEMNEEFERGAGPKKFSKRELAEATANFATTEKLGGGGFGLVYRGFLKDSSTYVAVKRGSPDSRQGFTRQGIKEYASEVRIISQLRHRNLVKLIGWCHEDGELLLVYEYMKNGSLDLHLFKEKSLLTWATRYKIAQGLASAMQYLHEGWDACVLHRDIKSSNVMLDSDFNAKLGDFGLAKLVDHEGGSLTATLAGTIGYMAPECAVTGKASKESDVFSFGVVALEIACGRKPIDYKAEEKQISLVEWVWELYGTGTLLEAADPLLGLDFQEQEMEHLMIVGLWCVHPDPGHRPSVKEVIKVLDFEASLPILPSKMPMLTYLSPPTSSHYQTAKVGLHGSSYNSQSSRLT